MKLDLTRLTINHIIEMLEARGYNETSTDIYAVEYVCCMNGQVKYKIKFSNDDIGDTGYVYIFIDDNGQLACDY
jgi:hypothetical protein